MIAWWLAYLGTSFAHVLLGVLALGGLGELALRAYGRQQAGLPVPIAAILVMLRGLAAALLLLLIGRPVWNWEVVEWQKPLLVVLLDQSASMSIADAPDPDQARSRAATANAAFAAARAAIRQLDELYEVRVRGVGEDHAPLVDWRIDPRASISPLAGAVREAGAARSRHGATPLTVLLISDGAENVEPASALRQAAADLAVQGAGLLAVGVGPEPGQTPSVELDPLPLPAELGLRDRLRLPVTARVQGCAGATLTLDLIWNTERIASRSLRVDPPEGRTMTGPAEDRSHAVAARLRDGSHISEEFELVPPGAGVHRLTARLSLPPSLGGQTFQTSAVVDVRDEPIRVLYLESAPRPEVAFVSRALATDRRLEVKREFLAAGVEPAGGPLDARWADYDVVLLGQLTTRLGRTTLESLKRAVADRGVGLLLAGGRALFNDRDYSGTPLEGVSPTVFVVDQFGLAGPLRVRATEVGLRHPALAGVGAPPDASESATAPSADESAAATLSLRRPAAPSLRRDEGERGHLARSACVASWQALPPLGAAARLGPLKTLAVVLVEDDHGRPLLVAHDVGRGRCVAAAWESTWAWALASDQCAEHHRRLWRQLVLWLANRRPRAWVLTDQPTYALPALVSRQARIRVRAGISGVEFSSKAVDATAVEARLELVRGEHRQPVALERRGLEWVAELPGPGGEFDADSAGSYILEFTALGVETGVSGNGSDQSPAVKRPGEILPARTIFEVAQMELELRPPTADLDLLRAAAEATRERGGGDYPIRELPQLLERLAKTDCRQEVRYRQSYRVVEREPWVLLVALVSVLGLEWAIRKRSGLA